MTCHYLKWKEDKHQFSILSTKNIQKIILIGSGQIQFMAGNNSTWIFYV